MDFNIAIDGPAGSGKSTIANILANKYNLMYINTGAMYRAVTLEALNRGIDLENSSEYDFLEDTNIIYENDKIFLNGKSVGREIRSTRVADNVSTVAKMAVVRHAMVHMDSLKYQQRDQLQNKFFRTKVGQQRHAKMLIERSKKLKNAD